MRICEYLWLAWLAIWLVWAIRTKSVQRSEGVSSRLSYSIAIIAGGFAMFSGETGAPWMNRVILPADLWIAYLGIAITLAGLLFTVWARVHLGGNWSSSVSVKVNHELVRTGPYRFVRHPIYSGIILAAVGTALDRREIRGFVAVALFYFGFTIKRRIEDEYMRSTFGSDYDNYMRSTRALFPRLRSSAGS